MTDVAVIGAGPAGLSAAINVVARGKTVRLLSGGENYLARAEQVDNYLGFYGVTGQELMHSFYAHAAQMGITVEKGRVANVLPMESSFLLNFSGDMIEAKAVVLATGVAKMKAVAGEEEFLGRGVSYCATCDGMLFRGKRAVVWGLAKDAAKEANFLADIGVQVQFVAAAPKEELNGGIPFLLGAVQKIEGEETVCAAVVNGERIPTDVVFVLRDAIAPSTLIPGVQEKDGYIAVTREMQTNIPGLFAAGDCTGKPLQISKAVGEGLIAGQQAAQYVGSRAE